LPISAAPTEEIRRQPFNAKAAKPAPRIIGCLDSQRSGAFKGKRFDTPTRRPADPPIRFPYTLEKAANNLRQTHPYEIAELLNSLWT
jgi:hypothetical protein